MEDSGNASVFLYRGLLLGGAALMGVLSMLGLLAVNLGDPVNVWVPIFLFALIPLVFSMITAVIVLVQPGRFDSVQAGSKGVLIGVLQRLMSRHGRDWYRDSPRLFVPWVQWQLQRSACLFMVCALITFFGFATFQDVRFVWSSTFIQQDSTMLAVFSGIALPWEWFLGGLSLESIQASRLNPVSGSTVAMAVAVEPLWPFVIASVVCYGLLPRLILLCVFRRQLRQRLISNIEGAGSVEAFLNRHQQESSQNALVVALDEAPVVSGDVIVEGQGYQIGWRLSEAAQLSCGPLVRNLGLGEWEEDESWLLSDHCPSDKPMTMLVAFWQTPTGECEDCLQLLRLNNMNVSLVLLGVVVSNERERAQLRSWQFFGEKCRVPVASLDPVAEGAEPDPSDRSGQATGGDL